MNNSPHSRIGRGVFVGEAFAKAILASMLLMGFVFTTKAQLVTNQPARFKTKIVLYDGKIGAGVSSTSINPSPEITSSSDEVTDAGTSPGHEHVLKWRYIGRNGDKDVYHFTFTRMTKVGDSGKTTTSKEVLFDGKRATIFEDELHTVIIETPSKDDLKQP